MSDTGIFVTTAEVQRKVGANISSVANVEAYINQFVAEAEAYINAVCRVNFSTLYSTLNAYTKSILKKWAGAIAAMSVINFDMSGFSRLLEAQTRLNVLSYEADNCQELLINRVYSDFIQVP